MKSRARTSIVIIALLMTSAMSFADPVTRADVDKAQVEMITRVDDAVSRYVSEIGIDPAYVTYCRADMYLRSFNHPANGQIPFGVNYNSVTDSNNLNQILSVREKYERSFLILCLANAKNALVQAGKR